MSFIHDSLSDPGVARKKDSGFRIIIVGGSIAGLTLAHCLDKAVIEYIVLERSDNILSQAGASIGILPNGARILDQLGLYDAVESEIEPLDRSHIYFPDEFGFTSNFPTILNERQVTHSDADEGERSSVVALTHSIIDTDIPCLFWLGVASSRSCSLLWQIDLEYTLARKSFASTSSNMKCR